MPLQATSGAASYDAFGGGVPVVPTYIEDVFSTWLYSGTSAAQTINNGIDLAGKGGLVWGKNRGANWDHYLADTANGVGKFLSSNNTGAITLDSTSVTAFNANGFSIGNAGSFINDSGNTYVSWTFREQPKFFDVVTYTGNGAVQTINHNLASVPGCIIVKRTDSSANWGVYHRSIASGRLYLDRTDAVDNAGTVYVSSTSTSFTFEAGGSSVNNASGGTYVAYLFAHNAGGFGLTGTDNVISCGSWTTNSDVNLGYEPQWILYRNAGAIDNWKIVDNMRGLSNTDGTFTAQAVLNPNTSSAEGTASGVFPTATGFTTGLGSATYIYIAIRRGPMKVPTTGTSVFKPLSATGTGSARTVDAGFPVDTFFIKDRTGLSGPTAGGNVFYDRLRGNSNVLQTQSTDAEAVNATYTALFNSVQNGVVVGDAWSSYGYREYCFRRAPGFFDEVCYTGSGASGQTYAHNLGAVPELMITKERASGSSWAVYTSAVGATSAMYLNGTFAAFSPTAVFWNNTTPTSTAFTVGNSAATGSSGGTYVAYLFASAPGVSKVGSYTGTGTTQTINCGFTAGSRFVLIKRTDSTGDWYVWDSARGIVAGNDPYLLLNSTAAEVTNTDYIDTASTGFEISSTAPAAINASGGTFIFLAIA
jgi:hypothetical protein